MLRPHFTFPALLLLTLTSAASAGSLLAPGKVTASDAAGHLRLSNAAVAADWAETAHTLRFTDKLHAQTIAFASPFSILLNDGRILNVADVQLEAPRRKDLAAETTASRYSDRVPGVEFDIPWKTADGTLSGTWSLVLRDGANYIRELLTLTAASSDVA
ncbi:MAG TPA: hypothetical protein VIM60_05885, partial [Edaphobacter sp.]